MKNLTVKLTIAAAAFAAAAGVASAQTLEANIPFAFRVGGKVLAPGNYQVRMQRTSSGNPHVVVRDTSAHALTLTVAFPNGEVKKAWEANGNAILSFQCGAGRCALRDIWTGENGTPAYRLTLPRLGKDELHYTTDIAAHNLKAD